MRLGSNFILHVDILIPASFLGKAILSSCCSVAQSCLTLCNPWTAAQLASLSFRISQSWLKLMMPSNRLILCRPLLLPPSIFPSIRVSSNESVLLIRWPKYWSYSFSISPYNEYSGLIFFLFNINLF